MKDVSGKTTYQIYCRDNTKEDMNRISRQLVKETLGARTNDYTKLANIIFDKETETVYSENVVFDVDINDYWDNHFIFDKISSRNVKKTLGKTAVDSLIINAVVPMLFYYGYYHSLESYKEKAMSYLEQLDAEDNVIIRNFEKSGLTFRDAFQTQAALFMYKYYCRRRRCLECRIYMALSKIKLT